METSEQVNNELIKGIETDARNEAQGIIAAAEEVAANRRTAGKLQLDSIMKEAQESAKQRVMDIKRNNGSTIVMETRRLRLKVRERIINQILQLVKEGLKKMTGNPEYTAVLQDLIVEAAIGLNLDRASVNASEIERDRIDDQTRKGAEKEFKALTGREIRLEITSEPPLPGQGIVLTSTDKRIAFNNQVATRLLRYQSEIRKMISRELFNENKENHS
ncbi:V-type proton ATPase subunit E [subsurface metagenome]